MSLPSRGSASKGTKTAALIAATDKGALRPDQMSKRYLEGYCASVIDAEAFGSDNGNTGPHDVSIGSPRPVR